jgi:hypothetical protein
MVRRDVFERVGGFREEYFLYTEDVDLCHEIRRLGLRVCHVSTAVVVHYGGESSRKQKVDAFAAVLMRESTFRFLTRTRGSVYARRYRRAIQAASVGRILILRTALLLPLPHDRTRVSLRKWSRILRWTRGLEPWAEHLTTTTAVS